MEYLKNLKETKTRTMKTIDEIIEKYNLHPKCRCGEEMIPIYHPRTKFLDFHCPKAHWYNFFLHSPNKGYIIYEDQIIALPNTPF